MLHEGDRVGNRKCLSLLRHHVSVNSFGVDPIGQQRLVQLLLHCGCISRSSGQACANLLHRIVSGFELALAGTGCLLDPELSSVVSVPGALACLSLVLQSFCDFFSPSFRTQLVLPL